MADDFEESFDGLELRKKVEESLARTQVESKPNSTQTNNSNDVKKEQESVTKSEDNLKESTKPKPPTIQLALLDDDSILNLSAGQPTQQQAIKKEEPVEKKPSTTEEKQQTKEPEKPKPVLTQRGSMQQLVTSTKGEENDESFPKTDGERTTAFMVKKGKGESLLGRKSWKTRFFVLNGSNFSYFDSPKDKEPLKTIKLHCSDTVENWSDPPQFLYGFKLCTFKRNLLVAVKSEKAQKKWIEKLKINIKNSPEYTIAERSV